jgi:hypothetical protein
MAQKKEPKVTNRKVARRKTKVVARVVARGAEFVSVVGQVPRVVLVDP